MPGLNWSLFKKIVCARQGELAAVSEHSWGGRSFSFNPRWRPISLAKGNVKRQCQCSAQGMNMLIRRGGGGALSSHSQTTTKRRRARKIHISGEGLENVSVDCLLSRMWGQHLMAWWILICRIWMLMLKLIPVFIPLRPFSFLGSVFTVNVAWVRAPGSERLQNEIPPRSRCHTRVLNNSQASYFPSGWTWLH